MQSYDSHYLPYIAFSNSKGKCYTTPKRKLVKRTFSETGLREFLHRYRVVTCSKQISR